VDEKDIGIAPGASQTFTFSLSRDHEGTYEVGIGQGEFGMGGKSVTLTVQPRLEAKQTVLQYDDGQARDCLSLVKPCTGYLISFVPPTNPFTISQIQVFGLVYGSPGYQISGSELQIWDKDQKVLYSGPFPGDGFPLRSRLGDNIDSTGGWANIDIPNVTVGGNFYIHIYTGIPSGQGFRMGAESNVKNAHSDVTVRDDSGADSISATWPYSIAYWYCDKDSVNWMVRVVGNAIVPQE
jgi:hypothetical protein